MSLVLIIIGIYLGGLVLAFYIPPFFPKVYHALHDRFCAGDITEPPYALVATFWPLSIAIFLTIFLPIEIIKLLIKLLPAPSRIVEWREHRQDERARIEEQETRIKEQENEVIEDGGEELTQR